jgi:hypothetical protein
MWFDTFLWRAERSLLVHVKKFVIPPWSMYNKHPVTWLSPKETKEKQQ